MKYINGIPANHYAIKGDSGNITNNNLIKWFIENTNCKNKGEWLGNDSHSYYYITSMNTISCREREYVPRNLILITLDELLKLEIQEKGEIIYEIC